MIGKGLKKQAKLIRKLLEAEIKKNPKLAIRLRNQLEEEYKKSLEHMSIKEYYKVKRIAENLIKEIEEEDQEK